MAKSIKNRITKWNLGKMLFVLVFVAVILLAPVGVELGPNAPAANNALLQKQEKVISSNETKIEGGGEIFNLQVAHFNPQVAHAMFGLNALKDFILNSIQKLILAVPGLIMWLSGVLFNLVIKETVVQMGNFVSNAGGITEAWTVLRDLANIVFIFILIWIGVATILQLSKTNYKQLLPALVIAALLVNFSMFITNFVIDTSNILAIQTIQQINTGCDPTKPGEVCANSGIAGRIAEEFGLVSFFDTQSGAPGGTLLANAGDGALDGLRMIEITVIGAIFMLIAAFVLLAGSVLLIIRFIVLIFLIIISPLAFAAMVLPQTKSQASKWWSALFNQAFFAPIFLLLIWASLEIMESPLPDSGTGSGDHATFANALINGNSNQAIIFIHFAIVGGLLVGSMILAKYIGAVGGAKAVKIGGDMGKKVHKGAKGAAGRGTVGKIGRKIGKSKTVANLQSKEGKRGAPLRAVGAGMQGLGETAAQTKFGEKSFDEKWEEKKKKRNRARKQMEPEQARKFQERHKQSRLAGRREIGKHMEEEVEKETRKEEVKRRKREERKKAKQKSESAEQSMGEVQQIVGTDERGNVQETRNINK